MSSNLKKEDKARVKQFIAEHKWIFAETYAKTAPHEYLVYENLSPKDKEEFRWFVRLLWEHGVKEKFYEHPFTYLYIGESKYWTHNKPLKEINILNRADADEKPYK